MKVVNSKHNRAPGSRLPAPGEEQLIRPSVAAPMLGVSADALVRRMSPRGVERLTFIDISKEGAARPVWRVIYSEVVALRDELIHNARQRTDAGRMLGVSTGSGSDRAKRNLKLVVNE